MPATATSAAQATKKKSAPKKGLKRAIKVPSYNQRMGSSPLHHQLRAQLGGLGAVSSRTVASLNSVLKSYLQPTLQDRIHDALDSACKQTVDLAVVQAATSRLWADRAISKEMTAWATARLEAYRASAPASRKKKEE